jgi:hypothetical protein
MQNFLARAYLEQAQADFESYTILKSPKTTGFTMVAFFTDVNGENRKSVLGFLWE